DAGEHDVQIMTIHKAKGLEFDTVIVPGLDRIPRAGDRPLLARKWLPDGSLLLAPINPTGARDEPMFEYIHAAGRRAAEAESARLLYVAATRAKARLHLLACVKVEDGDGLGRRVKPPDGRSLLACAWSVAGPVIQAQILASPGAPVAAAA